MRFLYAVCLSIHSITILINAVASLPQNLFQTTGKMKKIRPSGNPPVQVEELHLPDTKQRLIVVGDVHGNLEPFDRLLIELDYDPRHDHLILAGDFVGKGPQSIQVLQRMKEIGASCVRGNHDNLLLEWRRFLQQLSGPEVRASGHPFPPDLKPKSPYYPLARDLDEELYDYLKSCPVILSIPKYSLYVLHAGIDPSLPMDGQDANVVMNVKNLLMDGTPTRSNKLGRHWSILWNMKQETGENGTLIVYGHQASRGLNVQPYSIGLDTGCVYGKKLTAVAFPGNQLFSVDCVKHHRKPLSYLPIFRNPSYLLTSMPYF